MTRPIETTADKVRHEIYGSRYWLAIDGYENKIVTSMPTVEGATSVARDLAKGLGRRIAVLDSIPTRDSDGGDEDATIVAWAEP